MAQNGPEESFLLTLLFIVLLMVPFKRAFIHDDFDIYHLFLHLFMIQNGIFETKYYFNGPAWCVSIYIVLYCAFYAISYHSENKNAVMYKMIGLGLIGVVVLIQGYEIAIFNSEMASGIICFSIGTFLAQIYANRNRINIRFIGRVSIILLVCIYVYGRIVDYSGLGRVRLLFIITVAPMIILAVLFVPILNMILSNRIFQFWGDISYEIYLIHYVVRCIIKIVEINFGLIIDYTSYYIWTVYIIITISLATLYKMFLRKNCENIMEKLLLCKTNY